MTKKINNQYTMVDGTIFTSLEKAEVYCNCNNVPTDCIVCWSDDKKAIRDVARMQLIAFIEATEEIEGQIGVFRNQIDWFNERIEELYGLIEGSDNTSEHYKAVMEHKNLVIERSETILKIEGLRIAAKTLFEKEKFLREILG